MIKYILNTFYFSKKQTNNLHVKKLKLKIIFRLLVLYFKFKKKCCICLDYLNNDNKTLCCYHSFHTSCIDKWLKINLTCPLCRTYHFSLDNCIFIDFFFVS